ncbi:hypothetical protein P154DRAFT_524893 [Amniculicola lignicola CBS 123094]|uniref:Glyoxalase-like domain-containing protein n=1 Tax=Amniculicola lignicola CBS 123094 TaxID=1392246 RepID=A0A6A5W964_9PLEO|nr:hypothetical protein P154DRAFT_524893 [Amniculicola lignicola CBS 123094]
MAPITSLDHLVLFLPQSPGSSKPLLPSFCPEHFTLFPGGSHTDNLTANTLILLQDGCYLELVCFLPSPANAEGIENHWWGPDAKRKGWTDWCLTSLSAEQNYARLESSGKETHEKPVYGERKRLDGQDVKWSVTFPVGGQAGRGKVPFFCHDVTDRELRVPIDKENTKHPSGVVGVKELNIIVKDMETLEDLHKTYETALGVQGVREGDKIEFVVGRVHAVDGLKHGRRIVLRLAQNGEETGKVQERGFWYGDVVLSVPVEEGKEAGTRRRVDDLTDNVGGLWIEYVQ